LHEELLKDAAEGTEKTLLIGKIILEEEIADDPRVCGLNDRVNEVFDEY
jgi:hypothetical protein